MEDLVGPDTRLYAKRVGTRQCAVASALVLATRGGQHVRRHLCPRPGLRDHGRHRKSERHVGSGASATPDVDRRRRAQHRRRYRRPGRAGNVETCATDAPGPVEAVDADRALLDVLRFSGSEDMHGGDLPQVFDSDDFGGNPSRSMAATWLRCSGFSCQPSRSRHMSSGSCIRFPTINCSTETSPGSLTISWVGRTCGHRTRRHLSRTQLAELLRSVQAAQRAVAKPARHVQRAYRRLPPHSQRHDMQCLPRIAFSEGRDIQSSYAVSRAGARQTDLVSPSSGLGATETQSWPYRPDPKSLHAHRSDRLHES